MVLLHYPADTGPTSGIGRYSAQLAHALRSIGEPVRERPLRRFEIHVGHRGFGGLAGLRMQMALPAPRRGDVVHCTHLYLAHPRADVVTVHDCFPETYRAELGRTVVEDRLLARSLRRAVRRGTRFVAVSEATRREFLRLHPEVDAGRTCVVHPGVEETFAPAREGQARHPAFLPGALNVLCVADLNPRKRVDWLLQAAAGLDRLVRVVHAGPRTVQRPAWAAQMERERPWREALGDRLASLGAVGPEELIRLYQGADLLVVPSLDEGFGFPPLEALRCGTPVLAFDRPVFREVLGDEASYFRDPADLGPILERVRPDVGPAARVRRHDWVARTYGWESCARATREVYGEARSERARRTRSSREARNSSPSR